MSVWRAVVQIEHPALGGFGSNTWHLRALGPSDTPIEQVEGLMGLVQDFYETCSAVFASDTIVRWDGTVTGLLEDQGEFMSGTSWSSTLGGGNGPLPPANAIVVGWRTASGGRAGKGRTFLGPCGVNTLQADGTVTGDILTTVRAAASDLVASNDDNLNGAVGVFSQKDAGTFRDFTGSAVRDLFAVLRSRRD